MKTFLSLLVGVMVMTPALLMAGPDVGSPAPVFVLPDTAGVNHRLSQYRGKAVQLFFWESTSETCLAELPRVDSLTDDYGAQGYVALAINCNEDPDSVVKSFARQHTYEFLLDTGAVFAAYQQGTPGPPLNYIIDPTGVVRYWEEGFTESSLRTEIERWLPKPKDAGVVRITAPASYEPNGAAVTPACSVANFGSTTVSFVVRMRIGVLYDQIASVASLAPGVTVQVTFPGWTAGPSGLVAVTCSTELTDDEVAGNDRQTASIEVGAGAEPGWRRRADLPSGPKGKAVKDGGALTGARLGGRDVVYAFKGNGTLEFYRFEPTTNAWTSLESLPAIGSAGKKKLVKKGSALTAVGDRVFATKGASTLEFWSYSPAGFDGYAWTQMTEVPAGARALKEGTGLATVGTSIYLLKGSGTQEFYRYDVALSTWTSLAPAPLGVSGKPYKNGSALAYDAVNHMLRALKGSQNELFSYNIDSGTWKQEATLPFEGSSGRKKKAKDGAGLACLGGYAYAQKGNATTEFWRHTPSPTSWAQLPDVPRDEGKPVKNGGALTAASDRLYSMKGNKTFQFFEYGPEADAGSVTVQSGSPRRAGSELRVAPNPCRDAVTLSFTLPGPGYAAVRLFHPSGRRVTTLARGYYPAGPQSCRVSPGGIARGVYILKLESKAATATARLIVE